MRADLRRVAVAVGAAILLAGACSTASTTSSGTSAPPTTTAPAYPLDDTLRLNQIQALGSHNSYHRRTPPAFRDGLEKLIPGITRFWDYEHPPLDEQFGEQGIRQIELDVWADPTGGRFALHKALPLAGLPAEDPDPAMRQPGFKTFHIQELDFATTCTTFVACLRTVKQWSDGHRGHVPIMIQVEAKDDTVPDPLALDFAQPVKIGAAELEGIDAEIRSVFGEDQLITPDDVRGGYPTLEAAVLAGAWPTLGASRGKVMFTLDNEGLRDVYAAGHPSLEGRPMFTPSEPGRPDAAFLKRNDAVADHDAIVDAVKKGYVVRTRSDADTKEARAGDTAPRDAALSSGAQWVSTDYPVPDPAISPTFAVTIPGGTPARCNPLVAPPNCTPLDIENPAHLASS